MDIKIFDTLFEAEEYVRIHLWEVVYCSEFNSFLVGGLFNDHYIDVLYQVCLSDPGFSDFYSEANSYFDFICKEYFDA